VLDGSRGSWFRDQRRCRPPDCRAWEIEARWHRSQRPGLTRRRQWLGGSGMAAIHPCRSYERVAEYLGSGCSRPGHTGPHMPASLASSQPRTMMPMAPAVKAWIAGGFGIAAVSMLPPNSPAPMDDKFQCDFSSFEGSAPARFCAER